MPNLLLSIKTYTHLSTAVMLPLLGPICLQVSICVAPNQSKVFLLMLHQHNLERKKHLILHILFLLISTPRWLSLKKRHRVLLIDLLCLSLLPLTFSVIKSKYILYIYLWFLLPVLCTDLTDCYFSDLHHLFHFPKSFLIMITPYRQLANSWCHT